MVIAIIGATGLVGQTFLDVLEKSSIKIDYLYLYASSRSAGKEVSFQEKTYYIEELCEQNIKDRSIDFALFSAGADVSKEYAKYFTSQQTIVVDNSSAWRMDEHVPLVVPEVNIETVKDSLLIANPNCSTIQSVLPLHALNLKYGISDVIYTTYQAVSGSGVQGIEDLKRTQDGQDPEFYPYSIANNVIPHIDDFVESGFTKEEIKMINETKKILELPELDVTATCVRIPILFGHAVDIVLTLNKEFTIEEVRSVLQEFKGITVIDHPSNNKYPITELALQSNEVFVGRIRRDLHHKNRLHLFVVADNIYKGAAGNAVQIVEELIKRSE